MTRTAFILLLFLNPLLSFSQADSIVALLKKDKQDTNKVIHLNELSWAVKENDPDSSIILSLAALELCQQLESTGQKPLSLYKANCYANIGIGYYYKSDYPKSLENLFSAVKLYEKVGNKKGIASVLSNIGAVYYQALDFPKALQYYNKAFIIAESVRDKPKMASCLGNMASVYYMQKDADKAITYYQRSLELNRSLEKKMGEANCLNGIGIVHMSHGDYEKAMDYFRQSLKIYAKLGSFNNVAFTYGNIGRVYTLTGNYKEAFSYIHRSLIMEDSIGLPEDIKENYNQLSELYEKSTIALPDTPGGKLLNPEQMRLRSLLFYKRFIALRDTLMDEESKATLIRKDMNFQFDKKMSDAKAEQNKKDAVAQAENRKKMIVLVLVSILLLLVCTFSVFVFRTLKKTRQQKQIIEEKQREIVDSITYAKRIQQSLLPTNKYLQKNIERLKK